MDHLRNILSGAASLVASFQQRAYPAYGGFAADRRAMRADWQQVGNGLRSTLKNERGGRQRGKPSNAG